LFALRKAGDFEFEVLPYDRSFDDVCSAHLHHLVQVEYGMVLLILCLFQCIDHVGFDLVELL